MKALIECKKRFCSKSDIFHEIVEDGEVALEAGRLQDVVAVLGHDEWIGSGLEKDLGGFNPVLLNKQQ